MDQREAEHNFDAFRRFVGTLLPTHGGRFALLHARSIEGIYDRAFEALAEGNRRFPDGRFSIQEVTNDAVDLGFWSHAVDQR